MKEVVETSQSASVRFWSNSSFAAAALKAACIPGIENLSFGLFALLIVYS